MPLRRFRIAALVACALTQAGCVGTYLENRARDLFDPVSLDLAGGAGLGFHARASILHTGAGYAQMYHVGLLDGPPGRNNRLGLSPEFHAAWIIGTHDGTMAGLPNAFTDEPLYATWLRKGDHVAPHACWIVHAPGDPVATPRMRWWQLADVSAGANAVLVGARAGVSPGELLDFVLGWFGIDIAGDDARTDPGPAAPEKK